MKLPTHHGGRRVPALEVRLVLDHAQPLTAARWAAVFGVHPETIKAWRASGVTLDLWSAPSSEQWEELRAQAAQELAKQLSYLKG